MSVRFFILILLALSILSCKSKKDQDFGDFTEVRFSPGTTYTYQYSAVETDSTYSEIREVIEEFDLEVKVLATNRNFGGITASFKTETGVVGSDEIKSRTWYVNQPDRLIDIGYQNPGFYPIVQPRPVDGTSENRKIQTSQIQSVIPVYSEFMQEVLAQTYGTEYRDETETLSSDKTGDIIMREEPRVVYEYPLEEGNVWIAFSQPFQQVRRVEAVTTVDESPFGRAIVEIETTISIDPNFLWIDLIQDNGVFYREFRVFTTADPFGQGSRYLKFIKELVDVR